MKDDTMTIDEMLRGMHRRTDPHTSRKAAESILPRRYTIRQQVEDFARSHGAHGFIDEELEARFPNWAASSWRTRRSELAQAKIILPAGTRLNSTGREMTVWVHRDFHPSPPSVVEPDRTPQRAKIVRLEAYARRLRDSLSAMILEHDAGGITLATMREARRAVEQKDEA